MSGSGNTNKLVVIFVVLLVAALGMKYLVGDRYETGESAKAAATLFENLERDQIARLTIRGPEDLNVELTREGDVWQVASEGGYKADQTKVDKVLDGLVEMKSGRITSRNPDLTDFDLEGEPAIDVVAADSGGSPLAEVIVGKASDDFRSTFVRLPDENEVRKVDARLRQTFEVRDGWRDKTILDTGDAEEVERIVIAGPTDQVVFQKEEQLGPPDEGEVAEDFGGEGAEEEGADDEGPEEELEVKETLWNMVLPLEGVATKWQCDQMARNLSELKCRSFYSGDSTPADLGLDPPQYTITAERKDGTKTILYVGEKQETDVPVMIPGQDTIWMIGEYQANYFTKAPKDYLQNPPEDEPLDDTAVEGDAAAEPAGEESAAAPEEGVAAEVPGSEAAGQPADAAAGEAGEAPSGEEGAPGGEEEAGDSPAGEPAKEGGDGS
jgi:hypothetical protein